MTIPALPLSKVRRAGDLAFLAGEMPSTDDGAIRTTVQATSMVDARIETTMIAQAGAQT